MNMKKLATALSIVASIMASSSVFARAPIISGVPDIVIGDREDSLTIDNNWFRYANAFNILDYVTDVDSPQSDLLFTFVEQTTSKDLGIRIDEAGATAATVSQLDAVDSPTVVSDWTGHEITNYGASPRDYLLTFVDLIRSPEPYGSVPYPDPAKVGGGTAGPTELVDLGFHNTEGSGALQDASRTIWLYVADDPLAEGASRVDSDAITVISRNYGFDSLSGGVSSLFRETFDNGAGTTGDPNMWTAGTYAGMTACTISQGSGTTGGNGYISLACATAVTNGFTRWALVNNVAPGGDPTFTAYVGAIPYVTPGPGENLIYCARFTMSQNNADRGAAPKIRVGTYQANYLAQNIVTIKAIQGGGATVNPQIPAQNENIVYKVVWSAMEGAPDFSTLNYPGRSTPTVIPPLDMRTYNAFFDLWDQYNDQGGAWTLWNLDVVTAPRPANVTPAINDADFDAGGWTLDTSSGTQLTISHNTGTGAMTFNDAGCGNRTTPAFYYRLWTKLLDRTLVRWDSNDLLRFSLSMSVPAVGDRAGFHWFRLRENTLAFNVSNESAIMGDDGRISPVIGGYPYVPNTTPYTYETYLSSQVADASFDWTAIRNAVVGAGRGDSFQMYFDGIALPLSGSTGAELATHYTIHSLAIEVLDDTF